MNDAAPSGKTPIINCHAHIFTADHIPPYIGKTFLPFFLPFILTTPFLVRPARLWYRLGPPRWKHNYYYRKLVRVLYLIKVTIDRYFLFSLLAYIAGSLLTIHVFFILYDWLASVITPSPGTSYITDFISSVRTWLVERRLLYPGDKSWFDFLFVLVLFLFFPAGRNFILFIFRQVWKLIRFLPGKQTKAYFIRYWNIGRFSFYHQQARIFGRLAGQYPEGTKFVLLPMDMRFMRAGIPARDYHMQLAELAEIKSNHRDTAFPFLFVDPRRISDEPDFFVYKIDAPTGRIVLEDCVVRQYIEVHGFSGFKIYPALGYYPFDARLLPLWKYAAENDLPILTHCIRGTIFYRGTKDKRWDFHPVFKQTMKKDVYTDLLLPEIKNKDFCDNFTHPLNYLCLLDRSLLIKVLERQDTPQPVREAFGYRDSDVSFDLRNLKICMGHFGGDDEWEKYFEQDRHDHSMQLSKYPDRGIDFMATDGVPKPGKLEQIWKKTDWYSIICSMMLQHRNVYSDISYIIHTEAILPLLKQTLANTGLRRRVLFGTDFYVVRNHKSEKNMLADIMMALDDCEFDMIARMNPAEFLRNSLQSKTQLP